MPDIEEMVMAIRSLQELEEKIRGYQEGKIVRGMLLGTDSTVDDIRISLNTALQVLEKRVHFHQDESREAQAMKISRALS